MSFVPLINEIISSRSASSRNALLTFLCNTSQFNEIIAYLFNAEFSSTDLKQKESYLYVIEDFVLNKQDSLYLLTNEQQKQLIRMIVDYPLNNTDTKFYDRMKRTLLLLFNSLDESEIQNVFQLITEPCGLYSSYALVMLSSVDEIDAELVAKILSELIHKLDYHVYPSLVSFNAFMQLHSLKEIGENATTIWENDFGGDNKFVDLIKPLLISEPALQKMAINFVESSFHFLEPDKSIKIFFTLSNSILNILQRGNDQMKLQIASLFGKVPIDCSEELSSTRSQLYGFLKELAQFVTNCEGLYVNEVLNFVEKRKDVEDFDELISDLFKDPRTIRAATIIASEFNVFERKPKLLDFAFPSDITSNEMIRNVLVISPVLIKRRKVTREIFLHLSQCFFSILSNNVILSDPSIKPDCFCLITLYMQNYNNFTEDFAQQFLQNIVRISDKDILSCISGELKTVLTTFNDVSVERPDKGLYIRYFIHLAHYYFNNPSLVGEFAPFLRLFKANLDVPIQTYPQLIDYYVPSEFIPDIKSDLIDSLKEDESNAHYIMYFPSLSYEELKEYSKQAFIVSKSAKDGSINKMFFVEVFKAMSLRYHHEVFRIFYDYLTAKVSKAVQIFGIKHKQLQFSIKIAIIMTIGEIVPILAQNELKRVTQDLIYQVITLSLTSPEDFKQYPSCSKVIDVFPLLKDSTAPKELLLKVAGFPLFANSLFYIVKNQDISPQLVETMLLSWLEHITMFNMAINKNNEFCELLFRTQPTTQTLSLIISNIIPKLSILDPLVFCDFIYNASLISARLRIKPTMEELSTYLITSASLCLNVIDDVRKQIIKSLMNFFGILDSDIPENCPLKEIDLVITEGEKAEICICLFTMIMQRSMKEFSINCLQKIMFKAKTIPFVHSIIIRACLEINGDYIIQSNPKLILSLMNLCSQPNKNQSYQQIDTAFLNLSQKSMALFLPLLIHSNDIHYKRTIVRRMLESDERKTLFFEQFNSLLINVTNSLELFQILPSIIFSEKTSSSPTVFGALMQFIFIWISAIYANKSTIAKKLITKSKEEINNCIAYILEIANITSYKPIDFHFSDFKAFSGSIETLMNSFQSMDISFIQSFCLSCYKLITCDNQYFKQTAALCFIYLENIFGKCTSIRSVQLSAKLLESITISFKSLDQIQRRNVIGVLRDKIPFEYIKKLTKADASGLFLSLVENLTSDIQENGKEALEILSFVLPLIPKIIITNNVDKILICLRKVCDMQEFTMPFLDLLEAYVNERALFTDFTSNFKLNIVYLLELMQNTRQDVRNRTAALIKLLVENLETFELTSYMKVSEIEQLSLAIIKKVTLTSLTSDILNLIYVLVNMISTSKSPVANEFRSKVVVLCSQIIYGGQFAEQATNILTSLIP